MTINIGPQMERSQDEKMDEVDNDFYWNELFKDEMLFDPPILIELKFDLFDIDTPKDPHPPKVRSKDKNGKQLRKKRFGYEYSLCPVVKLPESRFIDWQLEIVNIEKYFTSEIIPNHPVRLNPWTSINDVQGFVEREMAIIKSNNGDQIRRQSLESLLQLRQVLESTAN